jgi:RHS repeat-associated protein
MKKIIIPISLLLVSGLISAQATNTENYIRSRTYLEPVTDSSNTAKQIQTVQYFDGLGRSKQIVNVKASPLGKDIVMPILYDGFGRQTRDYLPVPQQSTNNGAIYPQTSGLNDFPVGDPTSTYTNEKAFSERVLESSPLDRVLQQKQVGIAWNNKPIQFGYAANENGEVKKYVATFDYTTFTSSITLLSTGYTAGQLYKNTVTDEDGNTMIEFKNGEGQVVLVRKVISATDNADTYYVYNDYNQLAFVIPPKATVVTDPNSVLSDLCYQYIYDSRNRLVEKKLPGKGWEYILYDKQDRQVGYQDANLKGQHKWLCTKYDKFGRVVYTCMLTYGETRTFFQNILDTEVNNPSNNEQRSSTGFTKSGIQIYYTTAAFPALGVNDPILTVNYYDTYPTGTPSVISPILGQEILQDAQNLAVSTKSLPLASYVKNIEDDNWTKNYTWYDKKGRAISTHSINHLGGYTKTETLLDFAGVSQRINTTHLRKPGELGVTISEGFVYDNQNRLLQHYHKVDDKTEVVLTDNTYNELSQLSNKRVGWSAGVPLQSIDYNYNIRGWLTDINKNQMSVPNLDGKLFSYKIRYNDRLGIENPDTTLFSGKNVVAKYNGNIAEIDWRSVETFGVNPSITPKRYGYAYDKLNRLTAGYYQNPQNPNSKENTESIDYDLNGNIINLYRTSVIEYGNTTPTLIDRLEYMYSNANKSNKLTNINDYSYNSTGYEGGGQEIDYDLNGNMTSMPDKEMGIEYNYLNLPSKVNYNRNNIENVSIVTKYGADEKKLQKINTTSITGIAGVTVTKQTTDYLDGFQYLKGETVSGPTFPGDPGGGGSESLMANSQTRKALETQAFTLNDEPVVALGPTGVKTADLQFFPTAEGFYDYTKDQYIYQYKDHLGNVRISYGRKSSGALELVDANDYYPFGMNHLKSGTSFFGTSSYKNYKYNGKELQESGMYDYGARFYMPDLGRWAVVDLLSEKYFSFSNYSYAINRPTVAIDPDGKRVYFIGGAGNDPESQGWNYVNRWGNYFAQAGMNFYRVNATRGTNEDLRFTSMYRNTGYENISTTMYPSAMGGFGTTSYNAETRPVQDDMIDATVSMYENQLKNNPLQEGEQFNMAGYSYGSVLQAQAALRLADSGQVIDNVILIGSPISDKSDLMKQMKNNPNIKNVIRYDFSGDLLSNPKDIIDFLRGTYDSSPLPFGRGNDANHLDGARPGKQADQLIKSIIQWLQQQGVKN